MERIVPTMPQYHGVTERLNITLTNKAKRPHAHAYLPKQLWTEVVNM